MIRPMCRNDVAWAAHQHAALMPNSVFALFGERFLGCFYENSACSDAALAWVYEEDEEPAAVITMILDRSRFLRRLLLRHALPLAWYALRGLLQQRRCRALLRQLGSYPRRAGDAAIDVELLFITVSPTCRGKGVARALITTSLDACRACGAAHVCVTIEQANARIRQILSDFGFSPVEQFLFAGKPNTLLTLHLPANGKGD